MNKAIQAIRGMNDILPEEIQNWHFVENILRKLTNSYGYQEIRMPIIESTSLFKRTIGDVTDIVTKEMYTFDDRNGDSLSLRPEGTAACVRAAVQHGLIHNNTQCLWYLGPMYRHERPQKGRYRQFYQFGLEAFGFSGPTIDTEIIAFCSQLWQELAIKSELILEINTIGCKDARVRFSQALTNYLRPFAKELDPDSQQRLEKNPLRILDSKNERTQEIISTAPKLKDYLSDESKAYFSEMCESLESLNITFTINNRLVRGLDYYNDTVFEWTTQALGAQGTVCAGGRYDGLVEVLGGKACPAIGFALGMERLLLLIEQSKIMENKTTPLAYFVSTNQQARNCALKLSQELRQALPNATIISHANSFKLKNQLKQANKLQASFAVIIGEDELAKNIVTVKPLKTDGQQVEIDFNKLAHYFVNTTLREEEAS